MCDGKFFVWQVQTIEKNYRHRAAYINDIIVKSNVPENKKSDVLVGRVQTFFKSV
jgi:hypothetical protein